MKNRNGFTLIELLAVILVLGIIALIAIPQVNKVINESKVGANVATANTYYKEAQSVCQINLLNEKEHEGVFNLSEYQDNIEGNKNVNGYVRVNNSCSVELVMEADNTSNYCYVKSYNDDTVRYYKKAEGGACDIDGKDETGLSCFEYTENNGEITITGYKCGGQITTMTSTSREDLLAQGVNIVSHTAGEVMDVVIPASIDGKPVVKIGDSAFSVINSVDPETFAMDFDVNKKVIINSVVIPSSVREIGNFAFAINNITSLTLSEGLLSVGTAAFLGNKSLGTLYLPSTVMSISEYSFASSNITSIALGNKLSKIPTGAFGANKLKTVNIPDSVTTLSKQAFARNQLTSVNLNNVVKIGDQAFAYNNLSSINLNKVQEIGDGAFHINNLTRVVISSAVTKIDKGAFGIVITDEESGNPDLRTVVNNSGKSFDWGKIIFWNSGEKFETGSVVNGTITVNVIKE